MKRDARIGLAVVLVLGLGVTMLIGRALYKNGTPSDLDGDQLVLSDGTMPNAKADNTNKPVDANTVGARDDVQTTIQPVVGAQSLLNYNGSIPPGADVFIQDQSNPLPPRVPNANPGTPHIATPIGEPDDRTNAQPTPGTLIRRSGTAAASNEYYSYTVASGDSPWTISSKIFGDGKYTQKIVEANDLAAKKMKVGSTLKIPTIPGKQMLLKLQPYSETAGKTQSHDSVKPAPAAINAPNHPAIPSTKTGGYKIESGDTLASIAKKHYGASGPKTIQLIVTANHGLDPAKLKVGQEITLPTVKQN